MKAKLLTMVVLLAAITCFSARAQPEKKPLSNTDVVEMVKAGLAESVLIVAIQSSPANYDTSPPALIELNKQGVSAKVQEAMLAAQKASSSSPSSLASATNSGQPPPSTLTTQTTVNFLDGTKRLEMKQSQGKMDTSIAFVVVRMRWVFEGKEAQFRVTTNTPTFEVALMSNVYPSDIILLLKPSVKKDHREIFVGGAAPFAQLKPDKKKDTLPLAYEESGKSTASGMPITVYRVRPKVPLSAGEYVLSVQNAFYCFGVSSAQ